MIYMKNFHEGPSRSHALRGNAARTLRVPAFRLLSQRDRKEHLSKLRQRDFHLAGRGDEAWMEKLTDASFGELPLIGMKILNPPTKPRNKFRG